MCATCISDLNYQCYSFPRAIWRFRLHAAFHVLRGQGPKDLGTTSNSTRCNLSGYLFNSYPGSTLLDFGGQMSIVMSNVARS
jgi:hypothetical protein